MCFQSLLHKSALVGKAKAKVGRGGLHGSLQMTLEILALVNHQHLDEDAVVLFNGDNVVHLDSRPCTERYAIEIEVGSIKRKV